MTISARLAAEYYGDDVLKLVEVARSSNEVSTLHEATNGDPAQSQRWQENIAFGGGQEMIARLQTSNGEGNGPAPLSRARGGRPGTG